MNDPDDDYPPYPPDRYQRLEHDLRTAKRERDLVVVVWAGIIAGIAAGILLVVYGVL